MESEKHISVSTCTSSILACIFLTFSYVSSLYIWKTSLSRDHPLTIKRRFFSVSCMMVLAPFLTMYFLSDKSLSNGDLYMQLGLRWSGLIQAVLVPLFLTAVLFLGPLTMQFFSGIWKLYSEPMYWVSSWQDWVWVRNHVMAPLSEEWVFRACMIPLLLQCVDPMTAVFVGPLLFGFAHFHHMWEQIKGGCPLVTALLVSTFQFSYTSLFGAYSSYLFLRTGHFAAPLVAHVFCNHMGFPNFRDITQYPPVQSVVIAINFVLGLILWCVLLSPLTDPNMYNNRLHWDNRHSLE